MFAGHIGSARAIGGTDRRTHPGALALAVLLFLASGCTSLRDLACAPGEERSVSETLYFGTARAHGVVTAGEWEDFLRTAVTPRFPRGFTAWPASGQWQGADGAIVREGSYVLSIAHAGDDASDRSVRAIAADYKARFAQESVLRARSIACVSP